MITSIAFMIIALYLIGEDVDTVAPWGLYTFLATVSLVIEVAWIAAVRGYRQDMNEKERKQ